MKTLATTSTDAGGRFELAAEFDARLFLGRVVIVKAKGVGVAGRVFVSDTVKESDGKDEKLTFRLRSPATIDGRLLTPAGACGRGQGHARTFSRQRQ